MRRLIAVLAAALIAPALAAASTASAQAAPIDPASAVKKQLRPKHGVRISEISKLTENKKFFLSIQSDGVFQLGPSGIVASNTTMRLKLGKDFVEALKDSEISDDAINTLQKPVRIISVKGKGYVSGGLFSDVATEGKPWLRFSAFNDPDRSNQRINIFEPRTLRGLLASATRKAPGGTVNGAKTTLYRGTITYGELYKFSPSFRFQFERRPKGKEAKQTISWRLWIDRRGLPHRLLTLDSTIEADGSLLRSYTDTRYSGWGKRVVLKAPPKSRIADPRSLAEEAEEMAELSIPLNLIR